MSLSILVIDDEPSVLLAVRHFLVRKGHSVATALDGDEGVERASMVRPDVILCDSRMPRLSGKEMVALLRSKSVTAKIPVVIMSGNETPDTTRYAEAFIGKPFTGEDLFTAIDAALAQGVR